MTCTQVDPKGDDGDLVKITQLTIALGYHGVAMLSKPCSACGQLHQWRVVGNMPPDGGHIQMILRHTAAMIDAGATPIDLIESPPQ